MTEAESKMIALRERIEAWRQNGGGKGSRMPEELWEEAAELARVEGLYRASRELRLEYTRLKSRVGRAKRQRVSHGERSRASATRFVEIEMEPRSVTGSGSDCTPNGHTVVELADGRGRRLRIDVSGASTIDVASLAQAFWSAS